MASTIGKKLVNLQGLPYISPNLMNFGPETAGNGWQIFAHPLNFCIGRHCQLRLMDVLLEFTALLCQGHAFLARLPPRTQDCTV